MPGKQAHVGNWSVRPAVPSAKFPGMQETPRRPPKSLVRHPFTAMMRPVLRLTIRLFALLALTQSGRAAEVAAPAFMERVDAFPALEAQRGIHTVWEQISFRAHDTPFLAVATLIFLLAILHTFVAVPITRLARRVQDEHDEQIRRDASAAHALPEEIKMVSFKATILHFLGEVEAIFGIWVVVLLAVMFAFYDGRQVTGYLSHGVVFTEPLFVVVIMALASTRPILRFAEQFLNLFARLGKGTPAAWWFTILILAPLLGSFITEPGAMTIGAMLLARKFYPLKPSPRFAYATLGLLFVNVSVGGVLTNFAAPPVLMVAGPERWDLSSAYMFSHFGGKALLGIVASCLCYGLFFRKELFGLRHVAETLDDDHDGEVDGFHRETPIPFFVTVTHLGFMAWTVLTAHHPPLFIGGFLFFLAFSLATTHHQNPVELRSPIMVGFFLSGLVVHGGLQGWWLGPIISHLGEWALFTGATILTSFNDNAAITLLASQAGGLTPALKYAVLSGAVTGGGLTVIANAPNPAGQSILSRFFGDGVSPLRLAAAAFLPTIIVAVCFMCMPGTACHVDHVTGHCLPAPVKSPSKPPTKP
jgi:hypothetical protein